MQMISEGRELLTPGLRRTGQHLTKGQLEAQTADVRLNAPGDYFEVFSYAQYPLLSRSPEENCRPSSSAPGHQPGGRRRKSSIGAGFKSSPQPTMDDTKTAAQSMIHVRNIVETPSWRNE